tara:strand:+ start:1188 stop:1997 length:810 start_codon:yes stop_codon:yes gene_type:complete
MIKLIIFTEDDDCPICCSSMKGHSVYATPCGHHFHNECLIKQFQSSSPNSLLCAICRNSLQDHIPSEIANKLHISSLISHVDQITDTDHWGSELVDMINNMPSNSRGTLRTQLLITNYTLDQQQRGQLHLSQNDRENLHRVQNIGETTLGIDDSQRIDELVLFIHTVNSTAGSANASNASGSAQELQRVTSPRSTFIQPQVTVNTFRGLSHFLRDESSLSDNTQDTLSSRITNLISSLFSYRPTRGRRHTLTTEEGADTTILPWFRFGC